MRRILLTTLITLMVASSRNVAEGSPTLALTPGQCNACVSVVESTDGLHISFMQLTIDYNSECATFVGASLGPGAIQAGFSASDLQYFDLAPRADFPVHTPGCDRHVVVQLFDVQRFIDGSDVHIVELQFSCSATGVLCGADWDDSVNSGRYSTFIASTDGFDVVPPFIHFLRTDFDCATVAVQTTPWSVVKRLYDR
jgi:hypothetical protein